MWRQVKWEERVDPSLPLPPMSIPLPSGTVKRKTKNVYFLLKRNHPERETGACFCSPPPADPLTLEADWIWGLDQTPTHRLPSHPLLCTFHYVPSSWWPSGHVHSGQAARSLHPWPLRSLSHVVFQLKRRLWPFHWFSLCFHIDTAPRSVYEENCTWRCRCLF